MTEEQRLNKNKNIGLSMAATRAKRQNQVCRVYTVKIDQSRLSSKQKEQLKMLFVESKWIWNNCVTYFNDNGTLDGFNLKQDMIVKMPDGTFETRKLNYLGSQMKQSIVTQFKANVKTCFKLLKQGKQKHFNFKYKKKDITAIDLKQYSTTYYFKDKNKMKLQNIQGVLTVRGTKQFRDIEGLEYANAKILNTAKGYYVAITTYIDKDKLKPRKYKDNRIGIDFGCSMSFTTSEGEKINAYIQESDRLKKLQRKMFKQENGSKGRTKTISLIRKEYQKLSNQKNDLANKLTHYFSQNKLVVFQDEQLSVWKIKHGKKVHHSVLGRVKVKLKDKSNAIMINKLYPTTKLCTKCGSYHDNITLKDRTFICPVCGYTEDRDIHAANNMLWIYNNIVGPGRTEVTRKEIEPLVSDICNQSQVWSRSSEGATL